MHFGLAACLRVDLGFGVFVIFLWLRIYGILRRNLLRNVGKQGLIYNVIHGQVLSSKITFRDISMLLVVDC